LEIHTVAYLANEFPNALEWYVAEEIRELRRRGVRVIPCSAVRPDRGGAFGGMRDLAFETIILRPLKWREVLRAAIVCLTNTKLLADFFGRILWKGTEPLSRRVRALAHTLLGAAYAERLRTLQVEHIHVHHGYYSAWIGIVAARLLGIPFSLTLHGSDLLVNGSYLDTKLANCVFCRTISEFNRSHILAHFPFVDPDKVLVHRLGGEIPAVTLVEESDSENKRPLRLLSVGRLHAVKNHQFLIRACHLLRESGVKVDCWIVGDGPERRALDFLIRQLHLEDTVHLLGAVPHAEIGRFYELADLVVLTSHSEGIPLVLMEAMARTCIVLAPAITGIPELVIDGKTGFLYQPDDLEGFVWRVDQIACSLQTLRGVARAARQQVQTHFERQRNLEKFIDAFLLRLIGETTADYEDPVLQQI
jgi:colanic acid/amylovoran biosynthesis glycosyltransferase